MKKNTKKKIILGSLVISFILIGLTILYFTGYLQAISFKGTYKINCGFESTANGIITCTPDYGSTQAIDEADIIETIVYNIDSPYDLNAKQFDSFIPTLSKDTLYNKLFSENSLCERSGGEWKLNANYISGICSTTHICTQPDSNGFYTCSCADYDNYYSQFSSIGGFSKAYGYLGSCTGVLTTQYDDGDQGLAFFKISSYSMLKDYFTNRSLAKVSGYILDDNGLQVATFESYAICDLFGDGSSNAKCNLNLKSIPKISFSEVYVTTFNITLKKGGCDSTCEAGLNTIIDINETVIDEGNDETINETINEDINDTIDDSCEATNKCLIEPKPNYLLIGIIIIVPITLLVGLIWFIFKKVKRK